MLISLGLNSLSGSCELLKKSNKFSKRNRRFVFTEFVKICDELVYRMYDDLLRDYQHLKRQNKKLIQDENELEKQPCDQKTN